MLRPLPLAPRAMLRLGFFAVALLTLLLARSLSAAPADTLTVTNGSDSGPGSLRQAVLDAGGGDTILIDFPNPLIQLASPITVNIPVTIETKSGLGRAIIEPPAQPGTSRFLINNNNLTLRRIVLRHGVADGPNAEDRIGGAVLNYGLLTLSDVAFYNNRSQDYGGAIANYGRVTADTLQAAGNETGAGCGGFAWSYGFSPSAISPVEMHVVGGQINDNESVGGGGALCSMSQGGETVTTLETIVAEGNSANTGGFVLNISDASGSAALEMNMVTAVNNTAAYGGMLANDGPGATAVLTNVTAAGNEASEEGLVLVSANGASTTVRYSTFDSSSASLSRNRPAQDAASAHAFNEGFIKFFGSVARHVAGENCNGDGVFEDGGGNVFDDNTCYFHNPPKSLVDELIILSPPQDNGGEVPTIVPTFSFGIPNFIAEGDFLCGTGVDDSANGQARPGAFLDANFCFPGALQPPPAKLTVEKDVPVGAIDQGFNTQFDWELKAYDPVGWVTIGNDEISMDVPTGEIVLIEEKEPDWIIKSVTCSEKSGAAVSYSLEEKVDHYEITFTHDGLEPVTCRVENSLKNRITVTKKADEPIGRKWYFEFNWLDKPGASGLVRNLERNGSFTVEDLPFGDYEIVEEPRRGWALQSVDCQGAEADPHQKDLAPGVIVHLADNTRQDVHCTFYNTHEFDVYDVFLGAIFKPLLPPDPK